MYEPWSFKSIVDVVRASEEAGTDSEQSAQMQQDLILDRISMAAADPAEALAHRVSLARVAEVVRGLSLPHGLAAA